MTVTAAVALAGAAAALLAPAGLVRSRCGRWTPSRAAGQRRQQTRPSAVAVPGRPGGAAISAGVVVAAAGCLAAAAGGPVAALLAAVAVAVATVARRAARAARAASARRSAESELLAALAAELRSGRHPSAALAAVRSPADADLGLALAAARATAVLGGDVSASLRGGGTSATLLKLAAAWQLSETCGAPLADVVAQVASDVQSAADLHRNAHVELSGARATGLVLAALPLLGVALGTAMGADPIHVLLDTSAGAVCAAGGLSFELAGLAWLRRLTNSARRCRQ